MKKRRLFLMLGMAAMLASCSQEELGGTRADGAMTITATVDNGIGTRASTYDTDDVTIDRCLLEVYDADGNIVGQQLTGTPGAQEGTFTFTVSGLDPDAKYDFLFWADNNAAAAYDGSLKERKLNAAANLAEALAFQDKIEGSTPAAATSVTLTHAVAKVTLNTTGAMDAGDKVTLGISGVAGTWDVSAGTATGTASTEYAYTLASAIAQPQDRAEVTTFYVPAPAIGSTNDVTIAYASADNARTGSANITNVPLKANFRTVLTGDVAALYQGATASITAALDENWNDQDGEIDFPKTNVIETTGVGQITSDAIRDAAEAGNGTVIIKGMISNADLEAIAACEGLEINLDLSGATLMNDEGTDAVTEFPFTLCEYYGNTSKAILTGIILPNGIKSLAANCFLGCESLASVTLPEGLETIGSSALQNTAITSIDFPESLTTIDGYAFAGTKLEGELVIPARITFPSTSPNQYATATSVFSETNITSVVWESASPIQNNTFRDCKALKTITINGNCTGIDFNAIYGCEINELIINTDAQLEIGRDRGTGFNKATITSIKVPSTAVDAYKAASGWSYYEDIITAIE